MGPAAVAVLELGYMFASTSVRQKRRKFWLHKRARYIRYDIYSR